MPEKLTSGEIPHILKNAADNHLLFSQCYRRQWLLIQEVRLREKGI